jgi:pimeloyl-ACP methyl ester carboxylesterase
MKTLVTSISLLALAIGHTAEPPEVGGESRFARLGTNKIHYIVAGRGTQPLVLIHGWTGDLDWWRYQVPELSSRARLVLIDLPGHGRSDKPNVPYTMEFYADAVDAVLRDARMERAVLAGFSMGVPVMSRFYRDHAAKVQGLIAVDGALRGIKFTPEQLDRFLEPYRGDDYKEAAGKFLDALFPNAESAAMRARVRERALKTPQHVIVSSFEGMADSEAWQMSKLKAPLLVVNARSRYWTADYEDFVRQLQPEVNYNTIEGTGHFVMMEKPAEVNRHILAFLDKIAGSSSTAGSVASEAISLFNGKDLTGWRQYGKQAPPGEGWKAENGVLKKLAKVRGGDIITTNKFEDYDLTWEWRVDKGGNNGLKYLVTEQRPGAPGHEYQLIDDQGHADAKNGAKRMTASFYDVLPPVENKPLKPAGEWNSSRILLKGNHVEHWLNGAKVLEYELGSDVVKKAVAASKFKSAPGFGEKIRGHIMLTDHGDEAWFRNIKIRELK